MAFDPQSPIPVLPYSGHAARSPWGRWSLAITSAGSFALFSVLFEILASLVIAARWGPQNPLSADMFKYWMLFAILAVPVFVIAIFSCWLRLDVTAHSLVRRKHLWMWAGIYVAGTVAVAKLLADAGPGIVQNPLPMMGVWYLGVPAFGGFFLLRKVDVPG